MSKRIVMLLSVLGIQLNLSNIVHGSGMMRLSDERIVQAKNELSAQECVRGKIHLLAKGVGVAAVVGGVGKLTWDWYKGGSVQKKKFNELFDKYSNLSDERRDALDKLLEGRAKAKKAAAAVEGAAQISRLSRAASWVKKQTRETIKKAPDMFWMLFSSHLIKEGFSVFKVVLPSGNKFADYLFHPRTISWCIAQRTSFLPTAQELIAWAEKNGGPEPVSDALELEELKSVAEVMVKQVEKIAGFMSYITDKLPVTSAVERTRASILQKKIKAVMDKFCTSIDQVIMPVQETEPGENRKDKTAIIVVVAEALISVAQQFEYFKNIEKIVGMQDVIPTDIPTAVGRLIMPKLYQQSAGDGDES